MNELDANFWSERYTTGVTGWDLGSVSPPIKAYFDGVIDKDAKILIPGCGNAYEAEYLFRLGFKNLYVIDLVHEPLTSLANRVPTFPQEQIICGDFFEHNGQYDYIVEQTLFCAINPRLREDYVRKIKDLLSPSGKLVGLLFDKQFEGGPPFGGCLAEYEPLFLKYFSIVKMAPCYNSITPRQGSELFIEITS